MLEEEMPQVVAIAGDWHGDTTWTLNALKSILEFDVKHIIHVGDFGYWPSNGVDHFTTELQSFLAENNLPLWWVDGNHENHEALDSLPINDNGLRQITDNIFHIPRGYRWKWDDSVWMGLGGSVSIDRNRRTNYFDWFKQEAISDQDVEYALRPGDVDVLIAHDAPFGVPEIDMITNASTSFLSTSIARDAYHNRLQLNKIIDAKSPKVLFHGHYHKRYSSYVDNTKVIGLSSNRTTLHDNIIIITPEREFC